MSSWIVWTIVGVVLSVIDKRLLLLGAIVFGIGLAFKWW